MEESKTIIKEMHVGVCGGHYAPRTTTENIMRAGYYWPTLFKDVHSFVRTCRVSVFLRKTQVASFVAKPGCNRNSFSTMGYGFLLGPLIIIQVMDISTS